MSTLVRLKPKRIHIPGTELEYVGPYGMVNVRQMPLIRLDKWHEDLRIIGPNGRRRNLITCPGHGKGIAPISKGVSFPPEPLTTEEMLHLLATIPQDTINGVRNRSVHAPTSRRQPALALAFRRRPKSALPFPFRCRSPRQVGCMPHHKRVPMTCDLCGVEYLGRADRGITKHNYCGRSCSGRAARIGTAKPWQERFWGFLPDPLPPEGECWVWTGYHRPPKFYGILPLGAGKGMLAHRASYFLHNETELPPEIFVCHHCDNPPCVNPTHLFAGTIQDNTADMVAKGRNVALRGADNGMARFSTADVLEMRELATSGLNFAEIGRRFGTSRTHAGRIVNGVCRKDS